jgi:hypothetical protein
MWDIFVLKMSSQANSDLLGHSVILFAKPGNLKSGLSVCTLH